MCIVNFVMITKVNELATKLLLFLSKNTETDQQLSIVLFSGKTLLHAISALEQRLDACKVCACHFGTFFFVPSPLHRSNLIKQIDYCPRDRARFPYVHTIQDKNKWLVSGRTSEQVHDIE